MAIMQFEIQSEENYTLVQLSTDLITIQMIEVLDEQVRSGLLDVPYLIFEANGGERIEDVAFSALDDLNALYKSEDGLCIFAGFEGIIISQLEKLGIICIPTVDEAIDYIFMDQIEKELDAEGAQ